LRSKVSGDAIAELRSKITQQAGQPAMAPMAGPPTVIRTSEHPGPAEPRHPDH